MICFIIVISAILTIVENITPMSLDNLSIVLVGAIISYSLYFFDVHLLEESSTVNAVVGILAFLRVVSVLAMIYFIFRFEKLRGYFQGNNSIKSANEEE